MSEGDKLIKFADIARIRNGYAFKSKDYTEKGVSLIRQSNLTGHLVDMDDAKYLPAEFLIKHRQFIVNKGDVLIGLSGSIGEPSIYEEDTPALQNQRTGLIIPVDNDPNTMVYVRYLLLFLTNELMGSSKGAGIQNLSAEDIENLSIPFHNQNERILIIKRLDRLFSKIDEGVSSLEVAERQLNLYRQSVLKDAFEGKLTADWREDNPDLVEPADKLLVRIKAERKAAHQAELDAWEKAVNQWEANGKNVKKPNKPASISSKFSKINQIDDDLGNKFSWDKTYLGDLFGVYVGSTPKRDNPKYWGGSINWISSGEVDFCYLRATKETLTNLGLEETSTKLHPPGTLFLAMIGEGKTRGKAAISEIESAHNQNTAAIRISETSLLPEFYFFFMMYNYEITRTIGSGNNQKALNKARVEAIEVPLICVAEQKEVIDKIKLALEYILKVKDELKAVEEKAEALKQSILQQAFSGHQLLEDAL